MTRKAILKHVPPPVSLKLAITLIKAGKVPILGYSTDEETLHKIPIINPQDVHNATMDAFCEKYGIQKEVAK